MCIVYYEFMCIVYYEFGLSLCKIVRSSVILLLPIFTITMPNVTPFINKELRKAVYKKRQLHNKYNKCKTKSNWENYRQQRNLVNFDHL
jgi:hypothetical protein